MMRIFLFCFCISTVFAAPGSIYTPDWAIAAALTDMGYPPLAMGDKRIYPVWVNRPLLPDAVIDTGSRYQPNRELLAQLPITQVLDHDFYAHLRSVYPPHVRQTEIIFDGGNQADTQSWQTYREAVLRIGEAVGDTDAAYTHLRRVEDDMARYGAEIRAAAPQVKSYAVVLMTDSRQLRIYAKNSMFHVAFTLMGLQQSDLGKGDRWGNRQITLKDLAALPEDACLLIVDPLPATAKAELAQSYVWQRLGYGQTRCLRQLPAVWIFGGADAVSNFGRFLHEAMVPHAP